MKPFTAWAISCIEEDGTRIVVGMGNTFDRPEIYATRKVARAELAKWMGDDRYIKRWKPRVEKLRVELVSLPSPPPTPTAPRRR